jgi:D-alanyl-D-alanine carboxypeptidase (penicillin-binding protein 5/6)
VQLAAALGTHDNLDRSYDSDVAQKKRQQAARTPNASRVILRCESLTSLRLLNKLGCALIVVSQMNKVSCVLFGLAMVLLTGPAPAFAATHQSAKTNARRGVIARDPYLGAIVIDMATSKVLFEDHADVKGYPASVLKLMDLFVILDKIEQKELSLRDPVPVSAKAAQASPSKVWLQPGETFPVEEMLYALMVQSANDAAVALAEKVGGSVDGFLELMNRKAQELGMSNTVFHSVNGLPPAHGRSHDVTTARDLALLCRELLSKHPEALRYTSTRERTFRPNAGKKTVRMTNHNHLLGHLAGCDGLKTGFIAQAGYSLAVTAWRNGHRVIAVVFDSVDSDTRDEKATQLVAKGFTALSGARLTTAASHP